MCLALTRATNSLGNRIFLFFYFCCQSRSSLSISLQLCLKVFLVMLARAEQQLDQQRDFSIAA
jgi:hypothetical protein